MVELRDKETGRVFGSITQEQFKFLAQELEEESGTDTDYYINTATLDMFAEKTADVQLLSLLREALGARDEMEIEWSASKQD